MNVNNRNEIASYAKHALLRDNTLQKWNGYQPSTSGCLYSDPILSNPIIMISQIIKFWYPKNLDFWAIMKKSSFGLFRFGTLYYKAVWPHGRLFWYHFLPRHGTTFFWWVIIIWVGDKKSNGPCWHNFLRLAILNGTHTVWKLQNFTLTIFWRKFCETNLFTSNESYCTLISRNFFLEFFCTLCVQHASHFCDCAKRITYLFAEFSWYVNLCFVLLYSMLENLNKKCKNNDVFNDVISLNDFSWFS